MHCAVKNKLFSLPSGVNIILKTFNRFVNDVFHQFSRYKWKKKANSKVLKAK